MIRILFFGSPEFAVPSLYALAHHEQVTIEAVVTQPDKPKGRGNKLQPTPVALAAERLHIPLLKIERLNDHADLRSFPHADLFIVVAYGARLPPSLLSIPNYGAINLHPSLLPKYRGASPIQTALLNGDSATGVTVMMLDEELDHGPLLWQETIAIEHHDTAATLAARLAGVGAKLLATAIPFLIKGEIQPQPQDHAHATFTKQITKEDGKIDWSTSAETIARMVRAYYPWPGAWARYREKKSEGTLKIVTVTSRRQSHDYPPGLVCTLPDGSCAIACGENTLLELMQVQPSGKTAMPIDAFLNGHQNFLNQTLR
ncbi:methionyl-tRNA formyltransferase [Candidatus Uhrbacteria bacterium RIFCSPHIGHO2_12_FULL_54_23]|uniref:Methionyl-tRNA formyltransferase n=3 Tax=Candidatus Uhriibacteriota TaxID=1752732 RepID=A0A1F7UHZ9_9BACT|nr:MAG: methionyl-tRNA formyltransferase [Candidatus Uhrbacteria bacterium RIFCSPHIGHO2_12_FULL_54_23]OGL83667.1 MAG: methionyl-tRNA formyltransferase [Candidatus Uhrbacteria bacterium RIFCSPLOWO2_01_FULL_55_36]OGL90261.1 MAG: methionyl-tRNA formyltransferase [Candidatus Uhrbacteria bacterium RIFCSPLOWO2_02_FULL_54_37]